MAKPGSLGRFLCSSILLATWLGHAEGQTPLYVPDLPPRLALIQLSAPVASGLVTVTGAPGAVPGGSAVIFATLDTGHMTFAEAAADGSFTGTAVGPAGASIMIKADPTGRAPRQNAEEFAREPVQFAPRGLDELPGTIVHIPDAPGPGSAIGFAGVAHAAYPSSTMRPPMFTFQGTVSRTALQPGDTLRVQGNVTVASPALSAVGPLDGFANLRTTTFTLNP